MDNPKVIELTHTNVRVWVNTYILRNTIDTVIYPYGYLTARDKF